MKERSSNIIFNLQTICGTQLLSASELVDFLTMYLGRGRMEATDNASMIPATRIDTTLAERTVGILNHNATTIAKAISMNAL
jgi:hypothetical protein